MRDRRLAPVRATLRAVAEAVVPETASLSPGAWDEVEATIEDALAQRPEAVQRQLVTFLRLVEWAPALRRFRRFAALPLAARLEELRRFESSPRLLFRRGIWGVRTLVFLGYYTREDIQGALGYRAHADGWSARRTSAEMRAAATQSFGDE